MDNLNTDPVVDINKNTVSGDTAAVSPNAQEPATNGKPKGKPNAPTSLEEYVEASPQAIFFKDNPAVDTLYATSDGFLFLQKGHADSHGATLEDKQVNTFVR